MTNIADETEKESLDGSALNGGLDAGAACPICKGSMEVVWNSENRWRVSCMKNDFLDDDSPPPCTCPDFYGATKDAAIAAFMAANE